MHFDMFSSGMEHGVASEVDVAHIVVEDVNRIRKGNAQILQDALEPYGFACGDCRASVFSFCARQCDCRLLLTTPGDCSIAEGEDESGCRSSIRFVACPVRVCVSFESNGHMGFEHDVVIHHSTDIPKYPLSAIVMEGVWILHELSM